MVRDRAGQSTDAFDAVLAGAGIEVVKITPRSPAANAYAEHRARNLRPPDSHDIPAASADDLTTAGIPSRSHLGPKVFRAQMAPG